MGWSVATVAVTCWRGRTAAGVTVTRTPAERLKSPTEARYFFRWDSAYSSGWCFFW
jgi:hypothetical protein